MSHTWGGPSSQNMHVDAGHLNHGTRPLLHLDGPNPCAEEGSRSPWWFLSTPVRGCSVAAVAYHRVRERLFQYLGQRIYRRVNVASTCLASELVGAAGVNRARVPSKLYWESYANRYRRSTLCLHRLPRPCGVVSGDGEEGAAGQTEAAPQKTAQSSAQEQVGLVEDARGAWWWRGLTRSWSAACWGPRSRTSIGMHDDLKSCWARSPASVVLSGASHLCLLVAIFSAASCTTPRRAALCSDLRSSGSVGAVVPLRLPAWLCVSEKSPTPEGTSPRAAHGATQTQFRPLFPARIMRRP